MNEETYKDAQILAMGILNYINAIDEQGGDKQAMNDIYRNYYITQLSTTASNVKTLYD